MLEAYSDDAREKAEQETPYTFHCDECEREIEIGEVFYHLGDWIYCEDCVINARRIY